MNKDNKIIRKTTVSILSDSHTKKPHLEGMRLSHTKKVVDNQQHMDMNENDNELKRLAVIASGYNPRPYDLEDVQLPDSLLALTESLAENTHDCWAKARMAQGWVYGPARDDEHKRHPDLLPYSELPEGEKEYDRASAMNAVKLIVALGYTIEKKRSPQDRSLPD